MPVILATPKAEVRGMWSEANPGKSTRPYLRRTLKQKAGGPEFNPQYHKERKKNRRKERRKERMEEGREEKREERKKKIEEKKDKRKYRIFV
jgi:hypothetical protein